MAVIDAAALELEGGALVRREYDAEIDTYLALIAKGLKREDLDQLRGGLADLGLRLLELEARTLSTDFELARTHTFEEQELSPALRQEPCYPVP